MKLPDRLMRIGEFFYIQISNPSAALVPFRKGDIGEERRFSYLFKCASCLTSSVSICTNSCTGMIFPFQEKCLEGEGLKPSKTPPILSFRRSYLLKHSI